MDTHSNEDQPLVCELTAIPADAREEHAFTAPQLFALAQEVQELANGFAIRFSTRMSQAGSWRLQSSLRTSACAVPFSTLGQRWNQTADRSGCA
jgi:hypothetical protein